MFDPDSFDPVVFDSESWWMEIIHTAKRKLVQLMHVILGDD